METTTSFVDFISHNSFLVGIAIALVVFIIVHEWSLATRKYKDISPTQLVEIISHQAGAILDVREGDTARPTIRGAMWIPASTLSKSSVRHFSPEDNPVVVFCDNGSLSHKACKKLCNEGFSKVHHLRNGLASWTQANMPLFNPKAKIKLSNNKKKRKQKT